MGSGNDGTIPAGAAYVEQRMRVPADGTPRLVLWYRFISYDVMRGNSGALWDTFDVTINNALVYRDGNPDPDGAGTRFDTGWKSATIDLTPYRGMTVNLRFANWNREYDGNGTDYFNTWTYLDDIHVVD